jgi:hypothetical protein
MDTTYCELILYKTTANWSTLDHMANMKKCQWTLVSSNCLDQSTSLSHYSSFLILLQFLLGLLLLLLYCPWRFQLKTYFSMTWKFFLNVSDPLPFLQFICTAMCFFCPCLNNSSFEIMPNQDILKISLRYLFINVCMFLVIHLVNFHVSHPYLTLLLKDFNFVAVYIILAYHTQ